MYLELSIFGRPNALSSWYIAFWTDKIAAESILLAVDHSGGPIILALAVAALLLMLWPMRQKLEKCGRAKRSRPHRSWLLGFVIISLSSLATAQAMVLGIGGSAFGHLQQMNTAFRSLAQAYNNYANAFSTAATFPDGVIPQIQQCLERWGAALAHQTTF